MTTSEQAHASYDTAIHEVRTAQAHYRAVLAELRRAAADKDDRHRAALLHYTGLLAELKAENTTQTIAS